MLALIAIITFWLGGKGNEIVSYISFASALISIVLALVAIFYSIVQNVHSQQNIGEMRTLVSEASRIMTEKAGTLADSAISLEEALQQVLKPSEESSSLPTPLSNQTFQFDASKASATVLLIFYFLTKCYEFKKPLILTTLARFVINPATVEPPNRELKIQLAVYGGGLIHSLQCFLEPGSIVSCGEPWKLEIKKLPSGFKENIIKAIDTRTGVAETKKEHKVWLNEGMKKIDAHVEAEQIE